MRILYVTPISHRAGTWFRCFHLARELVRLGHEVTLLKTSMDRRVVPNAWVEEGVRIVDSPRFWGSRWSRGNTRLPSDLLYRSLVVLRERWDVAHAFSHHLNAVWPALLAKQTGRVQRVFLDWDDLWTRGGIYGDRPTTPIARLSHDLDALSEVHSKRLCDGVTVVSAYLRELSVQDGVPPERIHMLGNGCPIDEIRPGDRRAARERLAIPQDRPMAVFVGYGQYDIDLVLDALRILRARHHPLFVCFTGPHPDKTMEAARARGLTERDVRAAGVVPYQDMIAYIHASDVGLLPYADKPLNWARWPIKLGDYLAAGRPIATNDVGEMARMVRDHDVGVVTAPTAPAYADGLATLLGRANPASMESHARAVAEQWSWRRLAKDAERLYQGT